MAQERSVELVQTLPGNNQESRNAAQEGAEDPSAELLLLVGVLRSRDPARRLAGARALQRAGAPAVPLLLAVLADPDQSARREIYIKALGMIGSAARAALPQLEALAEDEEVGPAARDAVREIRRSWRCDGKRLVEATLPWAVALFVLAAAVNEIVSWLGLFDHLEGLALQVDL